MYIVLLEFIYVHFECHFTVYDDAQEFLVEVEVF